MNLAAPVLLRPRKGTAGLQHAVVQRSPCRDLLPTQPVPADAIAPLGRDELLDLLQQRWQASYDLQLVRRRGRLYLQVMWGYLEQQSFPLSAETYGARLEELVGAINGLGVADQVREWLRTTRDRPRLGKALSLPLELPPARASEFLLP
jgi:hypothetical protein